MLRPGVPRSACESTRSARQEWRPPKSGTRFGGDQLVPRDGYYDLRITAELWETYYYDYLALMTVDHPEGTDIFVDERFVIPPAKLGNHHSGDTTQDCPGSG